MRNSETLKRYTWKRGESGNPGGRPKGSSLRSRLKKYEEKAFAALESALTSRSRRIQLEAFKQLELAERLVKQLPEDTEP